MAANDTTTTPPEVAATATTDDAATTTAEDGLSEGAKAALSAARAEARDALKRAKAAEAKVKESEDRDKTDLQKQSDETAAAKAEAADAQGKLLRVEVATEKGLTLAQARRLVGTTRQELLKDADVFLKENEPADATSFDSGVRTPAPAGSMDAIIRAGRR